MPLLRRLQAAASSATAATSASDPSMLHASVPPPPLVPCLPVRDGEFVLSLPDQADSLALLGERLRRGRRQVLLGDDELAPRRRAPRCSACPGRGRRRRGSCPARRSRPSDRRASGRAEADLLGPDRERAGAARGSAAADVAGQQVGRADEPGHEARRRVARRRPPACPTCSIRPLVEDGQPVAHRERLLLVVGHVDERDADLLLDAP